MVELMHNTPFTDMNDSEGMPQEAGYATFESGSRALRLLTALVESCTIDADRVARNADAACVTVTELADTLVRGEGLSFRQAHEIAAATARDAIAHARPLGQSFAGFAAAFAAHAGRPPVIDAAAFAEAVSARGFVARRDRPGGPAPAALDAALAAYRGRLDAEATAAQAAAARIGAARKMLDAAFARLMED
jgi:argininosuccinate lyase